MTARSKDQLLCLGVGEGDCFTMPELELEEAKSLFLSYARMDNNNVDQILLDKCVKRCYFHKFRSSTSSGDGMHYHPLALKVLGSEIGDLIRQHDVARQAAVLARINTFNLSRKKEHPVFSILRSSFDSLLEEDQLLFLHVALFLPDYSEDKITSLCWSWDWLGMVHGEKDDDIVWRLEGLKRKSLLESFGKFIDKFRMHEVCREFESFRKLIDKFRVHEQWREFELLRKLIDSFRMHDLWREFAATEIEGGKWKDQHFLYKSAEHNRMVNVTGLVKVNLTGFVKMKVVKLMDVIGDVALDVRGLKQLKSLEVVIGRWEDSVLEINGLDTLENLTYLRCEGVASSACIAELGWLTNLQVVELVGFRGDKLPDMSKLTNLRILNIGYSRFLQRIELRNLTHLAQLNIVECTSLQSVDISGCRSMTQAWGPSSSTLEDLNVSSCPLLASVSGLVWGLTKLRKLDITGCSAIKELNYFSHLDALEELRARQCDSLTELPSYRLPKLRVLDIEPWKVPAGFLDNI